MKFFPLLYNHLNNSFLNQLASPEIKKLKGKSLLCTNGIEIIKLIVQGKYTFQKQLYHIGINLSLMCVFDKHDYNNTPSHLSSILMMLKSDNFPWIGRYEFANKVI